MPKHMVPQRSKEYMNFEKFPQISEIGHIGIISFVYVGK